MQGIHIVIPGFRDIPKKQKNTGKVLRKPFSLCTSPVLLSINYNSQKAFLSSPYSSRNRSPEKNSSKVL